MSFFLLLGAAPPADFEFGVGVNGILESSGVLLGSRWLLRGPFATSSSSHFETCRVGVLVEALERD